jgi:anti-sigma factor RsiW
VNEAPRLNRQDLHEYVDGKLVASDRERVARHLATHPAEAAEAEAYRAQQAGVHALYDGVFDEQIPFALRMVLTRHRQAACRRRVVLAAGLLLFLALSGLAGWWLRAAAATHEGALPRFLAEAAST